MKKLSFLLLLALVMATVGQNPQSVDSASNNDVLSGANADFNSVYTEGDDDVDVTTEAAKNDNDTITIFPQDGDGQYLYMGMETLFDAIYFDVESTGKAEDEDEELELTWQYNDGDSWDELDLKDDTVSGFGLVGTKRVSFDMPSDWDRYFYQGDDLYWVRVRLDNEIESSPEVDQISARAYNLQVKVKNEQDENLVTLSESNFAITQGTDNKIYAFSNEGKGEYLMAVQSEEDDVNYTLVVMAEGYLDYGIALSVMENDLMEVTVELSFESGCDTPYTDINYHWSQSAIRELYCRGIVDQWDASVFGVNRSVTRAEFLKMALINSDADVARYDEYQVPFDDVDEDDWYYGYVSTAYQLDYIDEDDMFYPNRPIERSEAVVLLIRMAGVETDNGNTKYSDVKSSSWYATAVRSATDYDVVEGYPDRTFKPGNNLTRAEAAVMINNAFYAWFND